MVSTQREAAPAGLQRRRVLRGSKGWVGRFSWSHAGDRIVVPSSDGVVRVWDLTQRGVAHALPGEGRALAAVFSPTDRLIASGGMDQAVRIWSSASGTLRRHLPAHAPVYALGFSADNATLAAGCTDGIVRRWAVRGWASLHNLEGDTAVTDLAWIPEGRLLACAHENGPVVLWDPDGRRRKAVWERPPTVAHGLAWSPKGRYLAGGYGDRGAVAVWDAQSARLVRVLESTSGAAGGLSFSADGRLLAVVSSDGTTRLWSCDRWEPLYALPGDPRPYWLPGVAFHPQGPLLAVPARRDRVVEVFEVGDVLDHHASEIAVRHATAKVVLLGDTRAGKTALGHRLATGQYREHSSTHGQQIWMLDALRSRREDGTEQEVLLWDLAGQRDYRPLHTLFLSDADVILLVFDASEPDGPLEGVRYWLRALERAGCHERPMILVGAQADEVGSGLPCEEIETLCTSRGISGGYVATSALRGDGLDDLLGRIRELIRTAEVTTTTTTVAFQRAKEAVLALKSAQPIRRPILSPPELRKRLAQAAPDVHLSERDLAAALGELIKHGHLQEISLGGSTRSVLLQPELLYNTAASLVVQARTAHHGVGAVDEAEVFAESTPLPGLPDVTPGDRRTLLDGAVRLLLERAVCVRETIGDRTLLVFPELVHRSRMPSPANGPAMEPLVAYSVEGAVENLFAVLAVRAGHADFVTGVRHWRREVDYEVEGGTWLVLRADQNDGRVLRLVLGRRGSDPAGVFGKLAGLIERFLLANDVALARFQATSCPHCHDRPSLSEVERNVRDGRSEMGCASCGEAISLDRNMKVDGREREETTLHEDKDLADRRFKFQPDLTSLKARVLIGGASTSRYVLIGDVERRWAKRWMLDVADAGIRAHAVREAPLPEHVRSLDPTGSFWLREAPLAGETSLEAQVHLLVPPDSQPPVERAPRGVRIWDFRDPGRYFFVLLEMLFELHHVPKNERWRLQPDRQGGGSRLAPDRAAVLRPRPVAVACIHARRDSKLAGQFARHVAHMERDGTITLWTPGRIPAGEDVAGAIARAIGGADVVVVLISPNLWDDSFWHHAKEFRSRRSPEPPLVPVLVRDVDIDGTEFAGKECLPRRGRPISGQPDPDRAWKLVAKELRSRLMSGVWKTVHQA